MKHDRSARGPFVLLAWALCATGCNGVLGLDEGHAAEATAGASSGRSGAGGSAPGAAGATASGAAGSSGASGGSGSAGGSVGVAGAGGFGGFAGSVGASGSSANAGLGGGNGGAPTVTANVVSCSDDAPLVMAEVPQGAKACIALPSLKASELSHAQLDGGLEGEITMGTSGARLTFTIPHGASLGVRTLTLATDSGTTVMLPSVLVVTEITVDENGDDTAIGSTAAPLATVESALVRNGGATKGDILVIAGTVVLYGTPQVTVPAGVTVRGNDGTVTPGPNVLNGFSLEDGAILEDLTITGFPQSGVYLSDPGDVTLHNLHIHDVGGHGINFGQGSTAHIYGDDPSKCLFELIGDNGIYIWSGYPGTVSLRTENCTLRHISGSAVWAEYGGSIVGSGLDIEDAAHVGLGVNMSGNVTLKSSKLVGNNIGIQSYTAGDSVELDDVTMDIPGTVGASIQDGTAVFNRLIVTGASSDFAVGIGQTGTMTCTDCDVTGMQTAFASFNQSTLTLRGGTIQNVSARGIEHYDTSTLIIERDDAGAGLTIEGTGDAGIYLEACGMFTMDGATISGSKTYGVFFDCTAAMPVNAPISITNSMLVGNPVGLFVHDADVPISFVGGSISMSARQGVQVVTAPLGVSLRDVSLDRNGASSSGSMTFADVEDQRSTSGGSAVVIDSTTTWDGTTRAMMGVVAGDHTCGSSVSCPLDGPLVTSSGSASRPAFRVTTPAGDISTP